jgi:hypothetical protein
LPATDDWGEISLLSTCTHLLATTLEIYYQIQNTIDVWRFSNFQKLIIDLDLISIVLRFIRRIKKSYLGAEEDSYEL